MLLLGLIVYLAIAIVCGCAAHAVRGDTPRGLMYVVLVGFLGASLGTSVANGLHLNEGIAIGVGQGRVCLLPSALGCAAVVAFAHLLRPLTGRWQPRH